jgi:hypothetical protein
VRLGSRRTTGTAVALACVVPLALVGCGPNSDAADGQSTATTSGSSVACQQVGSVHFDKTKFVLHAGLAYGAFHHFISTPSRAGAFHSGAPGRVGSLVKAGLAGLFVVHELKLAKQDAESSPTLCHLVAPLDEAAAALSNISGKLRTGSASDQELNDVTGKIDSTQQGAGQAGVQVPDQLPTDSQLANPPR